MAPSPVYTTVHPRFPSHARFEVTLTAALLLTVAADWLMGKGATWRHVSSLTQEEALSGICDPPPIPVHSPPNQNRTTNTSPPT